MYNIKWNAVVCRHSRKSELLTLRHCQDNYCLADIYSIVCLNSQIPKINLQIISFLKHPVYTETQKILHNYWHDVSCIQIFSMTSYLILSQTTGLIKCEKFRQNGSSWEIRFDRAQCMQNKTIKKSKANRLYVETLSKTHSSLQSLYHTFLPISQQSENKTIRIRNQFILCCLQFNDFNAIFPVKFIKSDKIVTD